MYLFVCFFKARKILTKNVGNVSVVNFVLFYFIFFLGLENSKCFLLKKMYLIKSSVKSWEGFCSEFYFDLFSLEKSSLKMLAKFPKLIIIFWP